jgi:hypothetical protein
MQVYKKISSWLIRVRSTDQQKEIDVLHINWEFFTLSNMFLKYNWLPEKDKDKIDKLLKVTLK